jgi:hypothetical protein
MPEADLFSHDLGSCHSLLALGFPARGFDVSLDVQGLTFLHALGTNLSKAAPCDDMVELCQLDLLTFGVFPHAIGGKVE